MQFEEWNAEYLKNSGGKKPSRETVWNAAQRHGEGLKMPQTGIKKCTYPASFLSCHAFNNDECMNTFQCEV